VYTSPEFAEYILFIGILRCVLVLTFCIYYLLDFLY
jgi:hypothetical protein